MIKPGERFGKLTVLSKAGGKRHNSKWLCECECGNTKEVLRSNLRRGATKSCGCDSTAIRRAAAISSTPSLDLTGQVFGRLTAIQKVGIYKSDRHTLWRCLCECGNFKDIPINSLRMGRTKSCGCLQQEVGKKNGSANASRYTFQGETRTFPEWCAFFNMPDSTLRGRMRRTDLGKHMIRVS